MFPVKPSPWVAEQGEEIGKLRRDAALCEGAGRCTG